MQDNTISSSSCTSTSSLNLLESVLKHWASTGNNLNFSRSADSSPTPRNDERLPSKQEYINDSEWSTPTERENDSQKRGVFEYFKAISERKKQKERKIAMIKEKLMKRMSLEMEGSQCYLYLEDRCGGLPPRSEKEKRKIMKCQEELLQAYIKKQEKRFNEMISDELNLLMMQEEVEKNIQYWKQEIIPSWNKMKFKNKVRNLWWNGIPSSVRSTVWKLSCENLLNLEKAACKDYVARAEKIITEADTSKFRIGVSKNSAETFCSTLPDKKAEKVLDTIDLDLQSTFPSVKLFLRGGAMYDDIRKLLLMYTLYNPVVGYVHGMSWIAAEILLIQNVEDAFICFANTMNFPLTSSLLTGIPENTDIICETFNDILMTVDTELFNYFDKSHFTHRTYLINWLLSRFAEFLNVDISLRIFDIFLRDGELFLFQFAAGLLLYHKNELLALDVYNMELYLNKCNCDIEEDKVFSIVQSLLGIKIIKMKFEGMIEKICRNNI